MNSKINGVLRLLTAGSLLLVIYEQDKQIQRMKTIENCEKPQPTKGTPTKVQPVAKPVVKSTEPTPIEPKTPEELPQPTPQSKPSKSPEVPKPEPQPEEPKTPEELPQPNQPEPQIQKPEEDEDELLNESIRKIKRLMFS